MVAGCGVLVAGFSRKERKVLRKGPQRFWFGLVALLSKALLLSFRTISLSCFLLRYNLMVRNLL